MTALTVAILAGGESSRMGQNKAFIQIGNYALIEHVIHTANRLSPSELLIVTNTAQDYEQLGYRIVADTIMGQGAIGGIVSALQHSKTDAVLVIACDMPFVQLDLLKLLIQTFDEGGYQAIIPTIKGYPQGVLAIYHRDCLPYFKSAIQHDQRKLKIIFDQLKRVAYLDETDWQTIDPHAHSFLNINTPDDLDSARDTWQQSKNADINEPCSP